MLSTICNFLVAELKEQCIPVKFCFKPEKTESQTQEILKTVSVNFMGRIQTYEWFSQFKHGETLVEDCEHSGHPSTGHRDKNVEKVYHITNKD
jgi:hypothetical protein